MNLRSEEWCTIGHPRKAHLIQKMMKSRWFLIFIAFAQSFLIPAQNTAISLHKPKLLDKREMNYGPRRFREIRFWYGFHKNMQYSNSLQNERVVPSHSKLTHQTHWQFIAVQFSLWEWIYFKVLHYKTILLCIKKNSSSCITSKAFQ